MPLHSGSSQDTRSLHPQVQGGYGPTGALTVTTTQAAPGARMAAVYLPPPGIPILSDIKGKVSSLPFAKA